MRAMLTMVAVVVFAVAPGAAQSRSLDATWSGTWDFMVGNVQLTQSGGSVSGKNVQFPNITFTGTVSGTTLTLVSRSDNGLQATCSWYKLTFWPGNVRTGTGYRTTTSGPAGSTPACSTALTSPVAGGFKCIAGSCLANTTPAKPSVLGAWEFLGGAVRVTASGAGFAGVVTAKTNESCSRPVGQHIWTIAARGATYAGTHVTYLRPGCKAKTVAATFAITQKLGTYTLKVCTGNVCTTHKRLKPPA